MEESRSVIEVLLGLVNVEPEAARAILHDHWGKLTGGALGVLVSGVLAFLSFRSRIRSEPKIGSYFDQPDLMGLPKERPAYSDRQAWVLAEMSALAYYRFEAPVDETDVVAEILELSGRFTEESARELIERVSRRAVHGGGGVEVLEGLLAEHGFRLVDVVDVGPLQGFVCRDERDGVTPSLILAFRGTEKNVGDWLTDLDALPTEIEEVPRAKVHGGFYRSFKAAEAKIRAIIEAEGARDDSGRLLPLYVTGHSLGGAWAMLATTLLAPDRPGACYTYGAPRIANYELFFSVKTPVFRVVNSADIVPRVPPGVVIVPAAYWALKGLAWLTTVIPIAFLSDTFERAARFVDRLKDYRHFGDQRYLTDVTNGRFHQALLLQNPPWTDQAKWFWKHIFAGFGVPGTNIGFPVKSHSMAIYRKKLAALASARQAAHQHHARSRKGS